MGILGRLRYEGIYFSVRIFSKYSNRHSYHPFNTEQMGYVCDESEEKACMPVYTHHISWENKQKELEIKNGGISELSILMLLR